MASNMDTVGTFEMARALSKVKNLMIYSTSKILRYAQSRIRRLQSIDQVADIIMYHSRDCMNELTVMQSTLLYLLCVFF